MLITHVYLHNFQAFSRTTPLCFHAFMLSCFHEASVTMHAFCLLPFPAIDQLITMATHSLSFPAFHLPPLLKQGGEESVLTSASAFPRLIFNIASFMDHTLCSLSTLC